MTETTENVPVGPNLAVGQVWADRDPRQHPRQLRIVELTADGRVRYVTVRAARNVSQAGRHGSVKRTSWARRFEYVSETAAP